MIADMRRWVTYRVIGWSLLAVVLLAPAVAMRVTDEINWSAFDFAVFASMLLGLGALTEVVAKLTQRAFYRIILALISLAVFIALWVELAVGTFD